MRDLANEREAIRLRHRKKLTDTKQFSLKTEPKKIYKAIFDRLNLAKELNDGKMVQNLRMAGFRGQGPVITFVAARVIMPALLFTISALYVFVLLPLELAFFNKLAIVLTAALIGFYAPGIYIKNKITKRQKAIEKAWPDSLDLMLICAESGMGLETAFTKVAEEIGPQSPELAEEILLTTAELSYLPDRGQAFENFAERTGVEAVKSLVISLGQSEKHGTPLGQSLRVLAQESRDTRMSKAERKAAQLPPKLTVPMVLFFLPVLFVVIIAPAILQFTGARP